MLTTGVPRFAFAPRFRRLSARLVASTGLASLLLLGGAASVTQPATAQSDTRTLSFLHLHTRETITVTFKRNGRFDDDGLKKLNWFLRDWRRNEETRMDPKLFDILWEVYREVGGQQPIEIISAYRSPGTNNMLRARSSGVAENSNHTHGQAIDFEIPGVALAKIREIGLRLQRGGVGFYPTSGSPFVHLDTGSIRHWPRMTREQLVKVFPNERTVHIPSDGQPLAGYALALADVQKRGNEPSAVLMAQARDAGVSTASNDGGKPRSILAAFFGGRPTADETSDDTDTAPVTPTAETVKPKPVVTAQIVPMPTARPKIMQVAEQVAQAEPAPVVSAPNTINARSGVWTAAVDSGAIAPAAAQSPFTFADTMTSTSALGYAAVPSPVMTSTSTNTPLPMPRPAKAPPMGAAFQTAAVTNPAVPPALIGGGARTDSPWLRAAILTPNVSSHMTTSSMGERDMRPLAGLFHKPTQALVMTFSADPGFGIVADRFTGSAVTFLATATFPPQTTASLR